MVWYFYVSLFDFGFPWIVLELFYCLNYVQLWQLTPIVCRTLKKKKKKVQCVYCELYIYCLDVLTKQKYESECMCFLVLCANTVRDL